MLQKFFANCKQNCSHCEKISCIRTGNEDLHCKFLYSVRIWGNTEQKSARIFEKIDNNVVIFVFFNKAVTIFCAGM